MIQEHGSKMTDFSGAEVRWGRGCEGLISLLPYSVVKQLNPEHPKPNQ